MTAAPTCGGSSCIRSDCGRQRTLPQLHRRGETVAHARPDETDPSLDSMCALMAKKKKKKKKKKQEKKKHIKKKKKQEKKRKKRQNKKKET
eukprot:NODE_23169_length_677_cov_8.058182.p2 GENE.NODE_23169_length_677_cov_8.058182~~NODE_23169_length_677_cov_8.058182.p2  ORF type:complete len:91 (+),score=43.81 NODE_23169_length_677_cov_8.058182:351-623(+)